MSFKANKAKLKIISKPLSRDLPEVSKISAIASTALQLANIKNIEKIKKETIVPTENVQAVENLDSTAVFEKVFKRGINPYRGEVVFVNEFQPLATGNFDSNDTKTIDLNFGNNKVLEVTNVARLIELQHILRKNAIGQSNFLIKRFGGGRTNEARLINLMERQIRGDKNFKKLFSPNINTFKKNLIAETKNNIRNIRLAQQINTIDNDYLELIAEYVLNKYIAREIVLYIARLFDFKEKIESGIELNTKSITAPQRFSSKNIKNKKNSNIKNLFAKGRANFPRNASQSFSSALLSFGRKNSKNDSNRSNFENLLNLTSHMISLIYCYDTIDDLKNINYDQKENITYGRTGNLYNAYEKLKKLTFSGCFSVRNSKNPVGSQSRINKSNLDSIYSAVGSDNNAIATAEMLAGICFSQVCWANFRKKQTGVPLSEKLENLNNFLSNYFINIPFADRRKPNNVLNDKSFKSFKDDESKKGRLFKRLFNERTYKGKAYIPFESNNTIASSLYEKSFSFPGEEIYFTSAIKNNDKEFSEFKKFTEDTKTLIDDITKQLIQNSSLDFDEEGVPADLDNTLIDKLNPLSYFNFYLKNLARDMEAIEKSKEDIILLAPCVNSAGDFGEIANSFVGSVTGILSKKDEFWSNGNWITAVDNSGFQAGSAVYATILSECKFRTNETMNNILKGTGVDIGGSSSEKFGRTGKNMPSKYIFGSFNIFSEGGNSKFYEIGVNSDFHFNDETQSSVKYGKIALTTPTLLKASFGLGEDTITKSSTGQVGSAKRFYKNITNTNSETLYDEINNPPRSGQTTIGNQFSPKSFFMTSVLFDAALNPHEKSSFSQVPEVTEDNAKKINTIDNMFFFKQAVRSTSNSDFKINDFPGKSGEMIETSVIQRGLVFYIFALGLIAGTQRIRAFSDKSFKIEFKKSRLRGLIKAIKGEELGINASESEKHAYEEALERIDLVKSRIISRQDYILRCIGMINDKIDSLVLTYKNLIDFSQGASAGPSFSFVKSKLDENNFFDETFSLLNPSYKDYLANSYLRNFCLSRSRRYSHFPEADTFHINDLKIMYKFLSQPGYGFLEKEKLGRKNIFHVGIPIGLLEYLRREAYKETGDEDYLDSSLIAITVYKNNQLSTETKYLPKQFVFDMSKHILPFSCDYYGNTKTANHILKMTDDISLSKIINNMEVFVFNEGANFGFKRNGYGKKGIVGNKTSDLSNNYENDSEFIEGVVLNQIIDYYLKLYTSLTTSIEINETMLLVDTNKTFTGELDNAAATDFKNKIIQKVLLRYPQITETEEHREKFFRAANSLNNSVILSSNNRLTEMLSIGCFERVFSILINERDFLIDDSDINSIYKTSPNIGITSKIQRTQVNPFYVSRIKSNTVKNYLNELNDKHTSMSGFSIDIGILKKW